MKKLKRIVYSSNILFFLYQKLDSFKRSLGSSLKVINKGYGRISRDTEGTGHELIIGEGTVLMNPTIRMRGRNNKIIFGKNCHVGPECSIWAEGENIRITVGDNVTFTRKCQLNAQEKNMYINIGDDCMFSNRITVRTSDSHPIYSKITGKRINRAAPVVIGSHVWVAPNSKIMKGVTVGEGTVIGSNTLITRDVPPNSLAVGMPGRVVKTDIEWTREDVIFGTNEKDDIS
ncbi:MAG: acyltransferase [Ruminococcus sp.]|nr:acyltransferase [Ruminococcus sp.]